MANKPSFDDKTLAASPDDALAAVASAGNAAADLVQAWVDKCNAGAVLCVAERGSGPALKAARRGLNVLKARRVPIPELVRVASIVQKAAEPELEATLMPPDTAGNLLITITARTPASRYQAALVFLNDSVGVQRVDSGEFSQSGLKAMLSKVLSGADYRPVKIPVPWARARIAAARKLHQERGTLEPLGFSSARQLLEPVPETLPAHPFDDEGLELSLDDAKDLAKDSAGLHLLPEFRGWFPPRAALDELLVKLGETMTQGEQPESSELQGKLAEQARDATDRYFSPQRREHLVSMMKDSALSVLNRAGEQKALEVAATMKVISEAGLITDPPHEVAFLRGFFEKALSVLIAQGQGSLRIPIPNRPGEAGTGAATEEAPAESETASEEASADPG